MIAASGIYKGGAVLLDESLDLEEGTRIEMFVGVASDDVVDRCVDGSIWDDSPEGIQRFVDWIDSGEPVLVGEEADQFEANLRKMRDQDLALRPALNARIEKLFP